MAETKLYNYKIGFKSGRIIKFSSEQNVDLHKIYPGFIAFDDLLVNLSEIEYIRKEVDISLY